MGGRGEEEGIRVVDCSVVVDIILNKKLFTIGGD